MGMKLTSAQLIGTLSDLLAESGDLIRELIDGQQENFRANDLLESIDYYTEEAERWKEST